jgi:16S rRNA (adenine1518-N6/adenine1519-N6)-dimethyltransferase
MGGNSSKQRPPESPHRALKAAGVRPSKARGQNFLVQASVANHIVNAAAIEAGDTVLEIGPGLGILTEQISAAGLRRLILVEIDSRLAAMLRVRFGDNNRVSVLERDFLTVELAELSEERLKVVGNLPFNAAAAIFRRLCAYHDSIARMVLMFQREVADRIRALPGSRNRSALSVFAALYWQTVDHFRVAAGSFYPRPTVDAEVLVMEPRGELDFSSSEEADLLATIRAAFSAPRKTIRNSLADGLGITAQRAEAALELAKIHPSSRPATLDCSQLVALSRFLRPATSVAYRA